VRRRDLVVGVLAAVAAAVALAFLVLPVAAIFLRVPPGKLLHQLTSPVVTDALLVSAKTSLIAQALIILFGTPLAYLVASRRFRGRALVVTLVELPLVLPPAVAGIGLLALFGRAGLLGTSIPFTETAVVLAVAFVSSPLYIRQGSRPSRPSTRTWSPRAHARRRSGPHLLQSRAAARARRARRRRGLAFARGLGEFGATIMFAGSLQGVTQTLSLAIYEEFSVDFDTALAMGALLVVVSVVLLVFLKLVLSWQPSRRTSASLFARSS
jgi:molybdate transport system permease protein